MAEVHGTCEARFAPVRDAFAANFDAGREVGASAAVVVDGELVVDLWAGVADPDTGAAWERDTVTNVWSTTKTMTALCALILADRGELDLHAPVARYWPEFAAAGKERVEVRHLLGHTAGLSGWDEPLEPTDLADWEKVTALLAGQAPWWEPGTASGYHAVTQGYLVGEVVRRVTGVSLGHFFAGEVAGPLGADFAIGLPPSEDGRVAVIVPPDDPAGLANPAIGGLSELGRRTLGNPPITGAEPNQSWWRRAEIPAANGQGNARSVATVQAVVAGGGEAGGVRLLSETGCRAVFEVQADGTDLVLGAPLRLGMGYGLASAMVPIGPRACFWGGWGGSLVMVDLDARVTVAYVMNRMATDLLGDRRGAGVLFGAVAGLAGGS